MERNTGDEGFINLIKMNDKAYVWNSKDWLRLRNLRIVGTLIGNLAALSKHEHIAGLPMSLLNEETTLLLEKGYAKLKVLSTILDLPNEELHIRSNKQREEMFLKQTELLKRERKEEIVSKVHIILQGKKERKRKASETENALKALTESDVLQEEFNKIENSNELNLWTQIVNKDPWITAEDMSDCEWKWPEESYPNYLVFKDLWEKGYYLTLGGKFGGDYLAYPGDPVKFHAYFIIVCLKSSRKLQMQDIITYGRLGQSVKKTVVLSYLNDTNQVCYHSIQWAG